MIPWRPSSTIAGNIISGNHILNIVLTYSPIDDRWIHMVTETIRGETAEDAISKGGTRIVSHHEDLGTAIHAAELFAKQWKDGLEKKQPALEKAKKAWDRDSKFQSALDDVVSKHRGALAKIEEPPSPYRTLVFMVEGEEVVLNDVLDIEPLTEVAHRAIGLSRHQHRELYLSDWNVSPISTLDLPVFGIERILQGPICLRLKDDAPGDEVYECDLCSVKPGSPSLCPRCYDARTKEGDKWRGPWRGPKR